MRGNRCRVFIRTRIAPRGVKWGASDPLYRKAKFRVISRRAFGEIS